ncbi:Hypothetical protein FKW44_013616, partial [Caligus rogercresseyi]
EIKLLKGVCDCLETVAAGSTGLGSRDMDLARGDRIMEFILTRLSKDTTQFGASMHQAILSVWSNDDCLKSLVFFDTCLVTI